MFPQNRFDISFYLLSEDLSSDDSKICSGNEVHIAPFCSYFARWIDLTSDVGFGPTWLLQEGYAKVFCQSYNRLCKMW